MKLIFTALALAASAGTIISPVLLGGPTAAAVPPCQEGYYQPAPGALCAPDPSYTAPTPGVPLPAPNSPGLVDIPGPMRVDPRVGSGTCSPGASVVILGNSYTCPPSGVLPPPVVYPVPPVVGQPPAAGSNIQPSGPPVTH